MLRFNISIVNVIGEVVKEGKVNMKETPTKYS